MNYAIRVTVEYSKIMTAIDKMVLQSEKTVVYQHDADDEVSRTHVHLLLVNCKVSTDTLKNWIKKDIGQVNKSDWSFKSADTGYHKFITYMSKGTLVPVKVEGFELEEINRLKGEWIEPRSVKAVNGKLVKEVDDAANISKRKLLEEMVAVIGDGVNDTRVVINGIRKVLVQHNIVIGLYKVMDYYDSYMMYANKETWLDNLAYKLDSRIYRPTV